MTTQTATSTWTIDAVHTSAIFAVEYMGIALYKGRFANVEGTISLNEADPARSSVSAAIDVKSLDIKNDRFYGHVMGDQFFDAEQYPQITFTSTGVEKVSDTRWRIAGDLSMHGVTKPVTLDTEYLGQAKHPFSGQIRAAFRATTSINRGDWGLTWNAALDNGAKYVGEKVEITLETMAGKQE
ncbi:MAG TPA: YceI family protein [Dehalococcoidia bacterium]|nr:YceI family protein [Dehalococcoidia bacterium]